MRFLKYSNYLGCIALGVVMGLTEYGQPMTVSAIVNGLILGAVLGAALAMFAPLYLMRAVEWFRANAHYVYAFYGADFATRFIVAALR